jgi:hypothetical protein
MGYGRKGVCAYVVCIGRVPRNGTCIWMDLGEFEGG